MKIDVQYMTLTYMEHSIPLYVAPLHKAGNAWLEANKPLEFTHNASLDYLEIRGRRLDNSSASAPLFDLKLLVLRSEVALINVVSKLLRGTIKKDR
ncbi:hypothetical protein JCM18382A_64480 [Bradyrhizobium sp. 17-4]